jgi:hypothetical protein
MSKRNKLIATSVAVGLFNGVLANFLGYSIKTDTFSIVAMVIVLNALYWVGIYAGNFYVGE